MHPAFKMNYFSEAKWEPFWIKSALDGARKVWTKYYVPTITTTKAKKPVDNDTGDPTPDVDEDPFAVLDRRGPLKDGRDAFEKYILAPVDEDIEDVISYWTAHLPAKGNKTITSKNALARMALDFLSAPATSTDVERLFSRAGLVVTKRRHNLKADSIRHSTILQNWFAVPDLVPRKAIAKKINDRIASRKRKRCAGEDEDNDDSDDSVEIVAVLKGKGKGKGRAEEENEDSDDKNDTGSGGVNDDDDDASDVEMVDGEGGEEEGNGEEGNGDEDSGDESE